MSGRAPWWTGATAGLCAVVLVLSGLPAAGAVAPTPGPTPAPEQTLTPTAAPVNEADPGDSGQPAVGSATPGPATDGTQDGATVGGALGPDGAPLLMDGAVALDGEALPEVPSVPVPAPAIVENQAGGASFGAADFIMPAASTDELTILDPRSLDGLVAATASSSATSGDSIVVGAAVAPLGALADAVFEGNEGKSSTGGRPDLVAQNLPRARLGDSLSVDVTPQLSDGGIPGAAFAADISLDTTFGAQWVDVAFDTSGFRDAFGGDYGDRLTLVALPACALTTPSDPQCLVGIPLESSLQADGVLRGFVPAGALSIAQVQRGMSAPRMVDLGTSELTEKMFDVSGVRAGTTSGGTIIAAVSGASSQAGTFKATDLAPRGAWGVTEPAGGFTYSIPVAAPPVSAGSPPSISLTYSSQVTDGKTSASNSQSGVVGEGWSAPVSYIERLYKPCLDDGGTTQELCWDSPYSNALGEAAYVMSLQGAVQELVFTSATSNSATYAAVSDPTLKVTRFFGTAGRVGNGDNDGEYFKVETNDGSVYYFGYNPIGTTTATDSVAWEPVWSNNPNEPGYVAGSTAPIPNQAYRFMLDVAVDANANASTHSYAAATNTYGTNKNYVRDIQLSRIDYGQTFNPATGSVTTPEAKVEFDLVKRCVEGAQFYDALTNDADIDALCADPKPSTAASYPDVPVDLICKGNGCSANQSPTYFSTVRLNQINTFARDGANGWAPVETTQLITAFPTTSDGSARSLWLDSVYTRGWGRSGPDDDVDTYLTKFSGTRLHNRVDWDMTVAVNETPQRPMDRMRISHVYTDLGGRIDVTYATANDPTDRSSTRTGDLGSQTCPQVGKDDPSYAAWSNENPLTKVNSAANDQLCYAVKSGATTGIYHTYVVTRVDLVDLVGGQPTEARVYAYGGSPAYSKADSVLYPPGSTGDNATFSSFRGFLTVASTSGEVAPSVVPVANLPVVPHTSIRTGDFDGDGKVDLFTADSSGQWKYSAGATSPWVNLGADPAVALADLRFGDFNGDGKTDVFSRTSAGQWRYSSAGAGAWTNLSSSGYPLADLRFGDFNGDHKTDVFVVNGAQWQYCSGGIGNWINLATEGATLVADLRFADFNGDGKDDVFSRTSTGQWRFSSGGALSYQNLTSDSNVPLAALRLADVNGDRKADIVTQNADGTWKFSSGGTGTWAPLGVPQGATLANTQFVELTGDRRADVFVQAPTGERKLWINGAAGWKTVIAASGTPAPITASTVTIHQYFRGTGATVASLQDGSSRTDSDPRLQGMLESSKTVDGAGATIQTSKATYTVTAMTPPSRDRSGVTPEHNPHLVLNTASQTVVAEGNWSSTTSTATVYHPTYYVPIQTTATVVDSRFPSAPETQCSVTDYASSTAPYMVVPVESRSYDGTCTGGTMTGKVQIGYDGGGPGATDQQLARGLVTAERSYSKKDLFSTVKAAYDAKGRIVGAWMPNDVGNAEPTVAWGYGNDGALWSTTVTRALGATSTTWTERGHGNTVKSSGATAGDWTHYQYDALGLMVAGWSPLQWGSADTPSLAENIPTVMYRYDIYANGPTLRSTPVVITTAPFVGDTGDGDDPNSGFPSSPLTGTTRRTMTFLDGLGRAIEQHAVAPDGSGGRTVTATRYNALGQVDWSSAAFVSTVDEQPVPVAMMVNGKTALANPVLAELPNATRYTYDARGRTVATTSLTLGAPLTVDGAQARTIYSYSGPKTTITAPNGATTTTTVDVLGRTASKVIGPDTAHSTELSQTTRYAYSTLTAADKLGFQQVTVTDVEDEATVFESNLAGQRTTMVDPNAGTTTYAYDGNGQTTSVTSPAGTITMGYDVLGRLVSRSTGGSSSATWDYVDPGESGAAADVGLLRSSSSTTHTSQGDLTTVTSAVYDALHRPVSSTTTLPTSALLGDLSGTSYTTTASYDAIGQPVASGLPAMGGLSAEAVTTVYRRSGSPEKLTLVTGGVSTPLVTGVWYSGTGQLMSRTYANGVTRAYGWDTGTRALTSLSASFVTDESGSTQTAFVQKDTFTRDVMGRIVQSTNEVPVSDGSAADGEVTAECFAYDGFNRLSGAWTVAGTGSATCGGAAPTDVEATGWDASATAYAAKWSYSAGGRIESLVKGADANAVTSTYAYEDEAHPAAVTATSGGATTDAFTYDGAGRMISRTVDGVTTALTWDVTSSLVESVGQGGHMLYAYDAGGQRVAQVRLADADGPGTATAYVASGQVEDPDTSAVSTGDVTATRFYTFAGSTVAVRTDDGELSLMLGDEQGSTSVVMPVTVSATGALAQATIADASAATRTAYTPYGQLRGGDNLAVDRGWLGQVEDRIDGATGTGLTYLNARYYDPATSRFVSPDPLVSPFNPITLDPYQYAANNPVVFTDANGMCYSGKGARGYNGSTLEATCAAPTDQQLWATVTGTDIEKTVASQQACRDKGQCGRAKGQTPVTCAYNKYCRGTPEADLSMILGGITVVTCLAATGGAGSFGCAALGGLVAGTTSYIQSTPASERTFGGGAKSALTQAALWGMYDLGIGFVFKAAGAGIGAIAGKPAGAGAASDPLIAFANSNRNTGTRFASEYTSPSGAKYYDVNAARQPSAGGHPLNATGHHGGCAEYGCLLQAFETEGPTAILGGTMRTVYVRGPNSPILLGPPNGHGAPASPCVTACQPLLDHLGVNG